MALRFPSSGGSHPYVRMPDPPKVSTPTEEEFLAGPGLLSTARPTSKWRRFFWVAGVLVTTAIISIGLALGLGLGLGLKHRKSGMGSGDATVLPVVSTPDSSASVMNMSLINEPPTTRHYDFVVEAAMGAPDGVEKLMLVVNGEPALRACTPYVV